MDGDQRRYLMRLVRMDIRKQKRNLGKLMMRPGQSEEEFSAFLNQMTGNLRFAEEAYRALGGDPDSITERSEK